MDWVSHEVPAWRISNAMDVEFCLDAPEEALVRHGRPDIFNTEQGSLFTSLCSTGLLRHAGIRISMDGRKWRREIGGLTTTRTKLVPADKLSMSKGRPLFMRTITCPIALSARSIWKVRTCPYDPLIR